jgi:hypothetical protein
MSKTKINDLQLQIRHYLLRQRQKISPGTNILTPQIPYSRVKYSNNFRSNVFIMFYNVFIYVLHTFMILSFGASGF